MLAKTVIVAMLVAVLAALGGAGFFMLRRPGAGGGRKDRMAKALALRVALSIAVFAFILLGWWLGWVQPGGLPSGR